MLACAARVVDTGAKRESVVRFAFLGTGTSSGVPAIGCACEVCLSQDPRDARLRTAAAVRWKDPRGIDRVMLLDAGPDLRQQALRAGLVRCDAIFFTHNHVDHTFGLDEVRRFNAVQREAVPIYADAHTMEHLRRVYKHIFDKDQNVNDSFVATLIPYTIAAADIEDGNATQVHGLRVFPLPLLHGRLPMLGYRIEAGPGVDGGEAFPLAYCTDVSAVPTGTWKRLRGLKTLVLDALRHRKHPTHLTVEQAVNIAAEVGAERTFFVHMSHDLPHAETQATLPETMFLAWDGLEI